MYFLKNIFSLFLKNLLHLYWALQWPLFTNLDKRLFLCLFLPFILLIMLTKWDFQKSI